MVKPNATRGTTVDVRDEKKHNRGISLALLP